ncbi:MAG: Ig-like domain-containing protein [Caldilineaceae bacterium]
MNKFRMNKWGASATLTALLLMGLLYLVGTSHPFFPGGRITQLLAAPHQVVTVAVAQALRQQATSGLNGIYAGVVAIQGVQTGVYSDTLTLPATPTGEVPANLGTIALSLQLTQTGSSVMGYVLLDRSMTFTTEHSVSIPGRGVTDVGPKVLGTFDGTTLTLESERFSSTVSGREIVRQFRLISNDITAEGGMITGDYRETLWGFAIEPSTAMGQGQLARPNALKLVAPPAGTNTVPLAVNDTATMPQGTAITLRVLANDVDAEGDSLTITDVDTPANGSATHDGLVIVYTPKSDFVGQETFTYTIEDGKGGTAVGVVVVEVTPSATPNRPPTAVGDTATTTAGQAVTINVLANDSDPDGDPLTVTILQQPQNGSAPVNGVTIVYTPNA